MNTRIVFCAAFLHQLLVSWCDDDDPKPEFADTISEFSDSYLKSLRKRYPIAFQDNFDVNLTEEETRHLNSIQVLYETSESNDSSQINDFKNNTYNVEDYVYDIRQHLIKVGKRMLKSLGYKLKNYFNPTLYLNHILRHASTRYVDDLEKYYDFIVQKKAKCDLDLEFIILDMVESVNTMLSEASKIMHGAIYARSNISVSEIDAQWLLIKRQKTVFNEKKKIIKYVCQKHGVCRTFPAYSDYVADVLKQILALPDDHFMSIVNILKEIIITKTEFFGNLMDDDVTRNISSELKFSVSTFPIASEFISTVKGMINKRFKIFNNDDLDNSSKAYRILIDMIDKTFEVLEDNVIKDDFINIVKNIDYWAMGKDVDIEELLTIYFEEMFEIIKLHWTPEIRQEVKVLIEIYMTGTSKDNIACDELLTGGSTLVRGEAIIYSDDDEQ